MQTHQEPARTDLERVQALLRSRRVGGNARLRLVELEQRLKSGFLSSESRQRIRDLYTKVIEEPAPVTAAAEPPGTEPGADIVLGAKGQGPETEIARLRRRVAELEAGPAGAPERGTGSKGAHADEMLELRRRLESAEQAARTARADAERAEEQVAHLRAKATHEANKKIRRIKRVFALHFHPDHVTASGLEREIRETIFKDFWRELDRVEREETTE
ncbi:MAG: hypothetical protein GVY13_05390 [Alphaproteobacteria bacterium]|jgi:hypothetical protein|nr:hypothetical protein [Alphaproteobacteria bacterium]